MNEEPLNENDNKLLAFCYNRRRTISEIASYIGISPKNVSVRLDKLAAQKLISIEPGRRNKKYIRTLSGDKTVEYFVEILKEIQSRGGMISQKEYDELLPSDFFEDIKKGDADRLNATMKLLYVHPALVDRCIKINDNGLRFIKEYGDKKKNE